jgi:hypothetical protein
MSLRTFCSARGTIASHEAPQKPELRGSLVNCMRGIYDSGFLVCSLADSDSITVIRDR